MKAFGLLLIFCAARARFRGWLPIRPFWQALRWGVPLQAVAALMIEEGRKSSELRNQVKRW